MTAFAPTAEAFVPSGHPVRRFVAAIVAVAAVSITVWWAGVFVARLSVRVDRSSYDPARDRGALTVTVGNRGVFDVRVTGLSFDDPRWRVAAPVVDEIAGGGHSTFEVPIAGVCDGRPFPHLVLLVRARTVTGVTRTVELDSPLRVDPCAP